MKNINTVGDFFLHRFSTVSSKFIIHARYYVLLIATKYSKRRKYDPREGEQFQSNCEFLGMKKFCNNYLLSFQRSFLVATGCMPDGRYSASRIFRTFEKNDRAINK